MKSIKPPQTHPSPQTTLFLKPSFSVTVLSSQMSVQVTAQPSAPSQTVRS